MVHYRCFYCCYSFLFWFGSVYYWKKRKVIKVVCLRLQTMSVVFLVLFWREILVCALLVCGKANNVDAFRVVAMNRSEFWVNQRWRLDLIQMLLFSVYIWREICLWEIQGDSYRSVYELVSILRSSVFFLHSLSLYILFWSGLSECFIFKVTPIWMLGRLPTPFSVCRWWGKEIIIIYKYYTH